jgi:HAD superfamily hydrolase (TIGR01509 family)
MSPLELVIFDCDGVLVDSELLSTQAIRSVLVAEGIDVPLDAITACIGMKQADILQSVADRMQVEISPAVPAYIWPATRALFQESLACTQGLRAFLDELPLRRCVASSSTHERIAFSLSLTGLTPYFEDGAIFSSSEVARGKPAPDLFLHAAARMGVKPDRCIVIEDSRFGVMGAIAAGMRVIGFTGGSHSGPAMARALQTHGATWIASAWPHVAQILAGECTPASPPDQTV